MSTRLPNEDVAGIETLIQAREWIDECRKTHGECDIGNNDWFPSRVIDVLPDTQDSGKVRLCVSDQSYLRRPYVTLTYCWGGDQPFMTNNSNFSKYLQGIKVETLPRTIQDAVAVTRGIGIRYLWIDSLCIIQDAANDKAAEMSRMHKIYGSSSCTIVAAAAHSVYDGFLLGKDTPHVPQRHLPFFTPDGSEGRVIIRKSKDAYYPYNDRINKRAWTFQERLMSHRLLIYPPSPHALQWSCRRFSTANGGYVASNWFSLSRTNPIFQNAPSLDVLDTGQTSKSLWDLWRGLVGEYSSCNLTNPQDRLVALSALAMLFDTKWTGCYLAGLWTVQDEPTIFLYSLLWGSFGKNKRCDKYVAPSWSWASANDKIIFASSNTFIEDTYLTLVDHKIVPAFENRYFGEVHSGIITIQGLMQRATVIRGTRLLLGSMNGAGSHTTQVGEAYMDALDEPMVSPQDVLCAVVFKEFRYDPVGLLLVPQDDGHYQRIAYCAIKKHDWTKTFFVATVSIK